MRQDHAVGPIRLPGNRAQDFVDHFNRVYATAGMVLVPVDPSDRSVSEDVARESASPRDFD